MRPQVWIHRPFYGLLSEGCDDTAAGLCLAEEGQDMWCTWTPWTPAYHNSEDTLHYAVVEHGLESLMPHDDTEVMVLGPKAGSVDVS
ncbi:hypothetical protein F7725_015192 [Dissostichus mawsoni]|uniref:Uncharacterized protein n=1 Tax=Dissostichus mawsoni TaxID=36200 RepID=A0A7J5YGW4_DISMA|nr:hypothetical protein F7725_015192 [Dissostichus mawsoni]